MMYYKSFKKITPENSIRLSICRLNESKTESMLVLVIDILVENAIPTVHWITLRDNCMLEGELDVLYNGLDTILPDIWNARHEKTSRVSHTNLSYTVDKEGDIGKQYRDRIQTILSRTPLPSNVRDIKQLCRELDKVYTKLRQLSSTHEELTRICDGINRVLDGLLREEQRKQKTPWFTRIWNYLWR